MSASVCDAIPAPVEHCSFSIFPRCRRSPAINGPLASPPSSPAPAAAHSSTPTPPEAQPSTLPPSIAAALTDIRPADVPRPAARDDGSSPRGAPAAFNDSLAPPPAEPPCGSGLRAAPRAPQHAAAPPAAPPATSGTVLVCTGKACMAGGAAQVLHDMKSAVQAAGAPVTVRPCKCMGRCGKGPNVRVTLPGQDTATVLTRVEPERLAAALTAANAPERRPATA